MYEFALITDTNFLNRPLPRTNNSRDILVSRTRRSTPPPPQPQLSNAEQETQAAAERLNTQVEAALATVTQHTFDTADDLEAAADRVERTARDLSVALRELARRRRQERDE